MVIDHQIVKNVASMNPLNHSAISASVYLVFLENWYFFNIFLKNVERSGIPKNYNNYAIISKRHCT